MDTNGFASRIRALRKSLGLSQTEFAKKLGVTQSSVTGYETGSRLPSSPAMTSICTVFGVRREWLEDGTGEMMEPEDDLSEICDKYGLGSRDRVLIEKYLLLPPAARAAVLDYIESVGKALAETESEKSVQEEIDQEVEEYRQQLIDQKKAEGKLPASDTGEDESEKHEA